jgi:hypothetical protein
LTFSIAFSATFYNKKVMMAKNAELWIKSIDKKNGQEVATTEYVKKNIF